MRVSAIVFEILFKSHSAYCVQDSSKVFDFDEHYMKHHSQKTFLIARPAPPFGANLLSRCTYDWTGRPYVVLT